MTEFDHFRKHAIDAYLYPVEVIEPLEFWFESSGIGIKTICKYDKTYLLMSSANIDAFCQWILDTKKMYNEDGVTLDSLHLTSKPELSVCASASLIIGISQPKNCSVNEAKKSMIACDEEVKQIKKSRKVACDEEMKQIKQSRKVACDEEVKQIKKSRKVVCDEEMKQIKQSRKVACDEEVKQIKKSRKVACDEKVKQIKKSRKVACDEEVKQIKKSRKVRTQGLSNPHHQWSEVGNVIMYEEHRCILESDKKWLDDAIINAVQYLLQPIWYAWISSNNIGISFNI